MSRRAPVPGAPLLLAALLAFAGSTARAQDLKGPSAAPLESNTQVGLRVGRERLSNGSPDWTDTSIEIARRFDKGKLLIGTLTESSRFGLKDTTGTVEGYYPFGDRVTGYAAVSGSGTHHVLPRNSEYGQLGYGFEGGWRALAGLKRASYNTTTVDIVDLGLERYFSDYRAAFAVLPAHSQTAGNATSYRLAFGYYYGDENRVQLLLTTGTEVDRPTAIDVVVATRVRSTALFGRHWFSPAWALDYAISRTTQGAVNRNGINAGLRYRF